MVMKRTTTVLFALVALLWASAARADFVYMYSGASQAGSTLVGQFTVADSVVASGSFTVADITGLSLEYTSPGPFASHTYILVEFVSTEGVYPIPVNPDGTFGHTGDEFTLLNFSTGGVVPQKLALALSQPPSPYTVDLGENEDNGTGVWTVMQTTTVTPEPRSILLALVGGACGFVSAARRRLGRRVQG